MSAEWNAARACEFWPDQRGHWAPVSWKDHLHDFNILYNGTILACPGGAGTNRNVRPEDQTFATEMRVRFTPELPSVDWCDETLSRGLSPDGRHIASWASRAAPEYIIEQPICNTAICVEQRQFAHVPGNRPVVRGDEPLFLWVRVVVSDVIESINRFDHIYCCLTPLKPTVHMAMTAFSNITFKQDYRWMPSHFSFTETLTEPVYLRVTTNSCRLAIPARQKCVRVRYLQSKLTAAPGESLGHIVFELPAKAGARIEFVLPMCHLDDATIHRELALGYDKALAGAEQFWKKELRTRTSLQVSEPLVQGWIDNFPRLEAMIAEKHPDTGDYGLQSGSYYYEMTWPTPFALCACALDMIGHGREVDKYLETYRRHQGTIRPPSPYLKPHPGYLGSPKSFSATDWITDHAAILWAAANHGLMTMDRDFLRRWKPTLVKACEFIQLARRTRGHKGYPGILPPGVANDCNTASQCVWNDAWHHKALRTAARLLELVGEKRGREFRKEADEYRASFQRAYRDFVGKSKRWRAADGSRLSFTPATLGPGGFDAAHGFHLDTGALALVFGELFSAGDPIMQAALRWFREGPQWKHYRKFSSEFLAPVLVAEMSSCEPCYSWNIFHSFELGDREKFAMGLYSLFAGGGSRQNFVASETREGVFGNCFTHGTALMLMRMAVLHEQQDTLHLLKTAPLAFFLDGGLDWRNMPTQFGEVSIAGSYDANKRALRIQYRPPVRRKPSRTLLHIPPFPELTRVTANGQSLSEIRGTVELRHSATVS